MLEPLARSARASGRDLRRTMLCELELRELVILHDVLGLVCFDYEQDRLEVVAEQLLILQRRLAAMLLQAGIPPADGRQLVIPDRMR